MSLMLYIVNALGHILEREKNTLSFYSPFNSIFRLKMEHSEKNNQHEINPVFNII